MTLDLEIVVRPFIETRVCLRPGDVGMEVGGSGTSMILVLLLGSAALGFMIAPKHNVCMVAASSLILAPIAATGAWLGGFGLLASIAITFACLTVSQMAYLLLLWLSISHEDALADKPSHNQSRKNRHSKIPNKDTKQKNPRLTA